MSETSPAPAGPVFPTPEQLAAWQEIIARVQVGDETGLLDWDEVAEELGLPH